MHSAISSVLVFRHTLVKTFTQTAHLEDVSSYIVLQCPVKCAEDLDNLLLLEDREKAVQEDLEADWDGLGAIQHQAADIEHHVGVHNLHLAALVHVMHLQLTQG